MYISHYSSFRATETVSCIERKIYFITTFLERIKIILYVIFIILFFLVGFIKKHIIMQTYSS